jgi:hypothetical protein
MCIIQYFSIISSSTSSYILIHKPVLRFWQKDSIAHTTHLVPYPRREMIEVAEGSILFMLADSCSDHDGFFISRTGL